jgi:xylose dehydrogenase (NAD/NADP)
MAMDDWLADATARDWAGAGETVRFAVVGLGNFTLNSAVPAIEAADACELGAAVSGDPEKADRVAADHGARGLTYDQFHAGDASDAYDAVYVCTPNALHLPYVETAADQGKAVLCEKPLEADAERADRLVTACEDAGVPLMTAYRMQTHPLVRRMRALVEAGAVGDPVYVEGVFSFRRLVGDYPAGWRLDADLAGGGALMDIGVYPLNTARFVLGEEPAAVAATTGGGGPGFEEVEAHVTFQLQFPGVTAACHASYDETAANRFEVRGTDGVLRLDPAFAVAVERTLTLERAGEGAVSATARTDEVREEFDYCAAAVTGATELEPDGAEGLADMRVVEAVYEAAETGERVSVFD